MGIFDAFVDDAARAAGRRRGRRPRHHARRSRRAIRRRRAPACCTARAAWCCRTTTATSCRRIRSRPASTTRRSGPSTRGSASRGRTEYAWIDDDDALEGFEWLARHEGILPALESSHARGLGAARSCRRSRRAPIVLVNLSGRGDKDVETVRRAASEPRASRREARMSRLDAAFDRLRGGAARRARDVRHRRRSGSRRDRREVLRALDRGGADVIEVGVPFSDPIADGPAIQRASERALAAGGTLAAALDLDRDVRARVARADRAVHVRESGAAHGRRRVRRRARPTPASTACCCSICRSKSPAPMRAALDAARPRSDLSRQPDDHRRAAARGRGGSAADSSTRFRGWASPARATPSPAAAAPLVARMREVTSLPVALGFGISRPEHVARGVPRTPTPRSSAARSSR